MKSLLSIVVVLVSLICGAATFTNPQTTRPINLPEETEPNAADVVVVDRDGEGTRKLKLQTLINASSARQSVATLSDLGSLTVSTNGQVMFVRGFYTALDWGEPRPFILDTSSSATTNLVTLANAGGSGRWIHPWDGDARAFGAIPDDSNNDGLSINLAGVYAKSSGIKIIKLAAGDYLQETSIVAQARTRIVGAGPANPGDIDNNNSATSQFASLGPTRIILNAGVNMPQIVLGPTNGLHVRQTSETQEDGSVSDSVEYGSGIQNLVLYGNGANQTRYDCHGVKLEHAWNFLIKDCAILYQAGYKVWAVDCNQLVIENLYGPGGTTDGKHYTKGILLWGTGDTTIDGSIAGYVGGPGIWSTGSSSWQNRINATMSYNCVSQTYTVSSVSTSTGEIALTSNHTYETGMPVELWCANSGGMPSGISPMRPYWAIKTSATAIKLATTRANALVGTAVIPSTTGSNLTLWHGPGAGVYVNWSSRQNTFTGCRFDQNQDSGIVLHDSDRVSVVANNLTFNGYDSIAASASSSPAAGLQISGTASSHRVVGNVFNRLSPLYRQDYGIWIRTNQWEQNVVNSSFPMSFIGNTWQASGGTNAHSELLVMPTMLLADGPAAFDGTVSVASNLTANGVTTLGNTNNLNSLRIYGNASGVRVLRMTRTVGSSGDIGIGVSQGGLNFYDESAAKQMAFLDASGTNTVGLTLGSTTSQGSPRGVQINGEDASGNNVSAGNVTIRVPAGTGNATPALFQVSAPVVGSAGSTAQTSQLALRVQIPETPATNQTPLILYSFSGGAWTERKIHATNIGGVNVLYFP